VTQQTFSDRSNANRKAKLMISQGEAAGPFKVEKRGEREYVIVWDLRSGDGDYPPTAPPPNSELAAELAKDGAAKATERASKRQERQGKAEARKARIQASQAAAAAPAAKPARASRAPKAAKPDKGEIGHGNGHRGSKYTIDPAEVTAGRLPQTSPTVTSEANKSVQKHFDQLLGHAKAGDWKAVRDYEVTGTNSYSKLVARYRQDLLAIHDVKSAHPTAKQEWA
jgi:hypothetical protein